MLLSLIYVSTSMISAGDRQGEVDRIMRFSQRRNVKIGVTGALMSTSRYFAQILEGAVMAVDLMMERICRDDRHADIVILRRQPVAGRRFADWSLAYAGRSVTLDDMLEELTHGADQRAIDELIDVMASLAVPVIH